MRGRIPFIPPPYGAPRAPRLPAWARRARPLRGRFASVPSATVTGAGSPCHPYTPLLMRLCHSRPAAALPRADVWRLVYDPAVEPDALCHAQHLSIPATDMHAAQSCAIRDALVEVLRHPHEPRALAHVQDVLALAYTSTLAPFHRRAPGDVVPPSAPHDTALTLLGLAAEVLVSIGSEEAMVLARKLLTYAQLHVGSIPLVHFHRMAAQLGRRHDARGVLQMERLAYKHHPDTNDTSLRHARLLASAASGNSADVAACWQDLSAAGPVPPAAHLAHVAHCAALHDVAALQAALSHMLAAGQAVPTSLWLDLIAAYAPLAPLVARGRAQWAQGSPADLLVALLPAMLASGAARYVPAVLQLAQVRGSEALPAPDDVPPTWRAAAEVLPPIAPHAATLALAATWCGRRGLVAPALEFFEATLRVAQPYTSSTTVPNERRPLSARCEPLAAVEHAAVGVVQALRRAGDPPEAVAFVQTVTGASLGMPPSERVAHLSPCVPRTSLLTAAVLECAGALWSVPLAEAALRDALAHGLRYNGRMRRALARLIVQCVDAHRGEMSRFCAQLAEPLRLHAQAGCVTRRIRQLQHELAALGFEDRVQRALLASDRQRRAAGERHPGGALHDWVRDTPLQPETPSAAPYVVPDAMPGSELPAPTGAAYAERLKLLAALGDVEGAQHVFRRLLEQRVALQASHVEALVQVLCQGGRARDASWVVRSVPGWGLAPTRSMYTCLIRTYMDMGDWRMATREIQHMQKNGLVPDAHLQDTVATAAARRGRHPHTPLPTAARDDIDVAHLASVAQHYQLLMHRHAYVAAQQFYATCLERGMVPDYTMRRMLRRAGHWLRHRTNGLSDDARTALDLLNKNVRASSAGHQLDASAPWGRQRTFRRALLALVRELVAGRLEKGPSMDTSASSA
ncbi:hypothetical protein MCAP1_002646 [Malassezia caprae]|uniref:Pentatricopeptide repeat-containing protein n=1 Tax=Malassezia caprae TaxID=1381934 RepID=A0AAF0ED83_9BASI|nr:hypothetical protein MCAP1_002646 [Malassezia caprae]